MGRDAAEGCGLARLMRSTSRLFAPPPFLQATVASRHYLSVADADAIAASGASVLVCVAERDGAVPPRDQRRLAELLRADEHTTPGGTLGYMADFRRFSLRIVNHMLRAAATG